MFRQRGKDSGGAGDRVRRMSLMVLSIAAAGGASTRVGAAEICVANDAEFAVAAVTAQFAPTTIELVQGTYHFDGTVFNNTQAIFQGFSLLGGYAPGCATRDIDATNTIVQSATDGLYVELVGDVTIEGIRFEGPGGALYLDWTDFDHDINALVQVNIRRNIFRGLDSGLVLNWVPSGSQTLDARIVNNLMHDNGNGNLSACNGVGNGALDLGSVEDSDATFTVINNTIVDNSLGGGICYGYAGTLLAYNNILYGNSGPDFSTANGTNALLIDNLFQTHNYHGIVTELGTLDTDPRLDSTFRPIESPPSPVINSGDNSVHGGLPSHDLDGGPRVVGSAVDRGAYESSVDDAFLQSVIGLHDFAFLANDPLGRRLYLDGERVARVEVLQADTGSWSLYQPGVQSDMGYHKVLRDFTRGLCSRLNVDRERAVVRLRERTGDPGAVLHAFASYPDSGPFCVTQRSRVKYPVGPVPFER